MTTTVGKGPNSFSSEAERPASGERELTGSFPQCPVASADSGHFQEEAEDPPVPLAHQQGWCGRSWECEHLAGPTSTEGPLLPIEGCLRAWEQYQVPPKQESSPPGAPPPGWSGSGDPSSGPGPTGSEQVWRRPLPFGASVSASRWCETKPDVSQALLVVSPSSGMIIL